MARATYAEEIERIVAGSAIYRTFGPASPSSARMARSLRRTVYPAIAAWRPTRRGIRIGRRAFEGAARAQLLRGIQIEHTQLGGVPVEWVVAPRAASALAQRTRVVLYLHGGGYVVGSPRTHRGLTARISQVSATPVASVDYRMAPEVSLRDSFADAVAAYRGLLDDGYPPQGIVVSGDSAGGGLAAGVALAAVEAGLPRPAGLVLLSPWLDLANGGASHRSNLPTESFIGGQVLDRISRALVPDEAARHDWHISPYHAPDELLRALPPTLVQVGGAELLLDDGVGFAQRIAAAGGTVQLERYEGQGHVVAMWVGAPEARRALRELGDWMRAVLPSELEPAAASDQTIRAAADSGGAAGARDLPA
ncbi:MAG: alpha/beta hydrolase [Patulibacter sp.]